MIERDKDNGSHHFWNQKRLLVYPRLFFIVIWIMVLINFAFRNGWEGRMTGIFGFDFLVFYSSGMLYRDDIDHLYDFNALSALEESLFAPNSLEGNFIPGNYPPYVWALTSTFTVLPISWAFVAWTLFSLLAMLIASRWIGNHLVPTRLTSAGLTSNQILVILLSFFPFIFGLHNGQNHAFTLLLVVGILVGSVERKPVLAGLMAGLLLYKPQFVLGYLVLWLVRREYRSLLVTCTVGAVWAGSVVVMYGFGPYLDYYHHLQDLFLFWLPFNISKYVNTTLLGFLATLLPDSLGTLVMRLSQVLMIGGLGLIAWLGYRFRNASQDFRVALLILAGLYPFIATPHVLMYDLLVFAPLFVLWSHLTSSRRLLYAIITIYLGSLILPLLSHWVGIALMGIFPIVMLIGLISWLRKYPSSQVPAIVSSA